MRRIGNEIGFEFSLFRASSRDPVVIRRGRGIVIDDQNYSVWPCPGLTVRVTQSADYAPGEHIAITTCSLRPITSKKGA